MLGKKTIQKSILDEHTQGKERKERSKEKKENP
jgi:hypothetical protein